MASVAGGHAWMPPVYSRPHNCGCNQSAHAAAVTAGRTGEDAHGHGRNFEEDVDVDENQQNEQRKFLHHRAGIGEIHHLRVILREQVSQDTQDAAASTL